MARAALQPGDVHLAAAQRHRRRPGQPVRDAQPHARLGVPPRVHRGDLEHAAGQLRARRPRRRPRAGQRPGRRGQRRPAGRSRPATTPTRSRRATALPPITNMYLWQPIAGSFYAPCVDGDFDMSVIAHEYTHAITNRMIAGPNAGRQHAAGHERELVGPARDGVPQRARVRAGRPARRSPSAQYVTGDPDAGIRNYNMSDSPLNYSERRLRPGRACRSTPPARCGAPRTSTSARR